MRPLGLLVYHFADLVQALGTKNCIPSRITFVYWFSLKVLVEDEFPLFLRKTNHKVVVPEVLCHRLDDATKLCVVYGDANHCGPPLKMS